MRSIMISAIFVIVMVANITDCHQFMTGLPGFPGLGPNSRFPFPSRRDPFSRQEILQKMDRLEHRVNQYLDAAIGFETRRNASDVQVLQGIRSTDVPQFFNILRQKLNAT
ncbi:unnamed protein product, partial [Oppiella nova]